MARRRRQIGFQLHESTRRSLCRLAVVMLGIGPLLICLLYCGLQFLPSYQRSQAAKWEALLTSQLGLTVKITAVENKTPVSFALHDIQLVNPENGVAVCRATAAEIQTHRGQWTVRLIEPTIEAGQLQTAWKAIHDWQMCQPSRHSRPTHLVTDELKIQGLSTGHSLAKVSAKLLPNKESLWLAVSFQVPSSTPREVPEEDQKNSTQSILIVKRDHQQLSTEIQLRSESPVPCSLVAGIVPQIEKLGHSASFTGVAGLQLQGNSWRANLTDAYFQQVDFGTLTHNTAAAVSGIGGIFINSAQVQRQRIEFAKGSVMIQAGRINGPFLQSIGQHLDVNVRVSNPVASHAFDSVAFALCIQPDGMKLAGQLPGNSIANDSVGSLASRAAQKWDSAILSLQSVVNVLDTPAGATSGPTAQLARSALMWLPIENAPQRSASLRLSRTH